MEQELNYHSYSGTKLSYSDTQEGVYTQIKGLKQIPDIGSEPEDIETTTFDNKKYKTAIQGLMDIQKYSFEFNMEDPTTGANINLVSSLEDAGTPYYFKLELANGVVISFRSKVVTYIKGGTYGDIIGFTMVLSPIGEPEVTLGE